ncbi:2952_t:CDS:1 [Ambispora leptoticha]|uniref:Large ribosomal subunit protein uL30m n=1 Tax=Ambispora leptoticha TaxID=144679 RepID=A0A9N8VPK5_9GLOM|nr:2952_t:CDS:1 [Ambispora leptoticha]
MNILSSYQIYRKCRPLPLFRYLFTSPVCHKGRKGYFERLKRERPQKPRTVPLSQIDPNAGDGYFKITLRRSTIGLPEKIRRIVKALGLKRLHNTVYREQRPIIAGMILKIKELVEVENVSSIPENTSNSPDRGYVIVKRDRVNSK